MHAYTRYVPASCRLHLAVSEKYDIHGPSGLHGSHVR